MRADKTRSAGVHRFKTWYQGEEANMKVGCMHCRFEDSALQANRNRTPAELLYLLLNVLQRLVDEFWQSSASRELYNTMCVAAICKCPPCVTSVLGIRILHTWLRRPSELFRLRAQAGFPGASLLVQQPKLTHLWLEAFRPVRRN